MEKFSFENTTIFKEINKLSKDEINKWVKFILKKNFETKDEYFLNKIKKLKPTGGFHLKSTRGLGGASITYYGNEFVCNYGKSLDSSLIKSGIEIDFITNHKDKISPTIIYIKPTVKKVGLFGTKKINIITNGGITSLGLYHLQTGYKRTDIGEMSSEGLSFLSKVLDTGKYKFIIKFIKHYNSLLEGTLMDYRKSIKAKEELLRIKNEKIQKKEEKIKLDKQKTSEKKNSLIKELDRDSDGILDIVQTNDFYEILKKHEKSIIEIDREYIKNFVKLSNYLQAIRNNLQNTFEILSKVEFSKDLQSLTKILKNKIHTYNSLLLHSLSMVVSLTKDEMITFYEIYEMFDELNVYNSKHEKDMLNGLKSINSELRVVNKNLGEVGVKLGNISGQFYSLMNQMKESDERIINSINNLTYTTSSSIKSLSNNVQSELQSINSSVKFNNLLTGIQTYQMYKVNLNTKSLRV